MLEKDDGYRGVWYMNAPTRDEYVYKYSGGLGTYCAKHQPFAVYCPEVDKTFFCYGGAPRDNSQRLLHMVSWFDHATGRVPRPTLLLDKQTDDAHDNPVISVDGKGHVWVLSTAHGPKRPSFVHRSTAPYSVDAFKAVEPYHIAQHQRTAVGSFAYMQVWHHPTWGFSYFFTRYGDGAKRALFFATSADGERWENWVSLAAIEEGHYQISAVGKQVAGTAFDVHPKDKGLDWRTNLYYMETHDRGWTWKSADGRSLSIPVKNVDNAALVVDYAAQGLLVYVKDILFDAQDRPVILYLTSKGPELGPRNDPRTWRIARWTGEAWRHSEITTSDNNYDMGSLYLEEDGTWRIIAPTLTGPQAGNPGGEMAMWTSADEGLTWTMVKQLTKDSPRNHTFARRPVNAHPGFYAFWADGHGRKPSESRLYFCDRSGRVFMLPPEMNEEMQAPQAVE